MNLFRASGGHRCFPGLAISLTVFGYAAFGNGLERIYDR